MFSSDKDNLTPEQRKAVALTSLYYNFEQRLEEPLRSSLMDILKSVPAELVEEGCRRTTMTHKQKFLPVAVILENIPGWVPPPPARSGEELLLDQARTQFERLVSDSDEIGRYSSRPGYDDVTESALRSIGGWDRLCDLTSNNRHYVREDFVEAYMRAARYGAENVARGAIGISAGTDGAGLRRVGGARFLRTLQDSAVREPLPDNGSGHASAAVHALPGEQHGAAPMRHAPAGLSEEKEESHDPRRIEPSHAGPAQGLLPGCPGQLVQAEPRRAPAAAPGPRSRPSASRTGGERVPLRDAGVRAQAARPDSGDENSRLRASSPQALRGRAAGRQGHGGL